MSLGGLAGMASRALPHIGRAVSAMPIVGNIVRGIGSLFGGKFGQTTERIGNVTDQIPGMYNQAHGMFQQGRQDFGNMMNSFRSGDFQNGMNQFGQGMGRIAGGAMDIYNRGSQAWNSSGYGGGGGFSGGMSPGIGGGFTGGMNMKPAVLSPNQEMMYRRRRMAF